MATKKLFLGILAAAAILPTVVAGILFAAGDDNAARPEGPCDVYAKGGAPCAAAHATTRALYASYNGPLYQVMRESDGKTLDIGVVKPSAGDNGGYADAAAQDAFCENTTCWITVIYDQSPNGNHLYQAPRGGFSGLGMGGFNNIPVADWAPVTLMGHKVYGVLIAPGMGMRNNDTRNIAVDDQAEGQYWVINGQHYNSGCCFDYGNAETDSRDDGDGTMETTYFGNLGVWYHGEGPGPWIMTDQENNLTGCANEDPNDKFCDGLPSVSWRFITATADGEPHHWRSMGGDAQGGELSIMYDGMRIKNDRSSYDPMRKQGAILLGNGGDNSNGSAGTFYEGAMTEPGTMPSEELNQAIQANVVAAGYDVQRLSITPSNKTDNPTGVQTFYPGSTKFVTVSFTNTTGSEVTSLSLSVDAPRRWKALVAGTKDKVKDIAFNVAPGQTVAATFAVTSPKAIFNGDLRAVASWKGENGKAGKETAAQKVRNVPPVTINEYSPTFVELYNAGEKAVNISDWTLTSHQVHMPIFSNVKVPRRTVLAPGEFYVMGLSSSGLSVDAAKGDKTIYVRDVTGIKPGDEITIGWGKNAETHKVVAVNAPAPIDPSANPFPFGGRMAPVGAPTTLWQPLPDGPVITIPAGSTSIPVTSTAGMVEGGKLAIGYGAKYPAVTTELEKYEIVTIKSVGKPGTQAYLSMDAKPGDTNIKVSSTANISVGDTIRLDISSVGHGIETVKVKAVGTPSKFNPGYGPSGPGDSDPGTGLELEAPIKYFHSANMPFSCSGSGVSVEPATKVDHSSNEPVLALVYSIELDSPLKKGHGIDEAVCVPTAATGYKEDRPADQLFGGPAFAQQGNLTLRTGWGFIVDAVNYGGLVDPWLSEGYNGAAKSDGSWAPSPLVNPGRGFGAPSAQPVQVSAGRLPDGADSDDNRADFRNTHSLNLAEPVSKGADTIVFANARDIDAGYTLFLGSGENEEQVKVGFILPPRTVSREVSFGGRTRVFNTEVTDVVLTEPLKKDHPAGTGAITGKPTPGYPNKY